MRLGLPTLTPFASTGDPLEWAARCLRSEEHTTLATLWAIWNARNIAVMEQRVMADDAVLSWVVQLRGEFQRGWVVASQTQPPRWAAWTQPATLEVALNCDGSRGAAVDSSGYGGCLHDSTGAYNFGFIVFGRSASVLHLELMVIYRGLLQTWNMGYWQLVCFSDSQLAISLVHHPPLMFHELVGLVGCIRDLIQRDWEVRLLHTLREGNACADRLAKADASQGLDFCLLQDPPLELVPLLLADAVGTSVLRP